MAQKPAVNFDLRSPTDRGVAVWGLGVCSSVCVAVGNIGREGGGQKDDSNYRDWSQSIVWLRRM